MQLKSGTDNAKYLAELIEIAGGQVVGRTRLQKIAYLLELTGLGNGLSYQYKHYGPFSQDLASASELATMFGKITEEKKPTNWGGHYSVFSVDGSKTGDDIKSQIVSLARDANPVDLELAATAAYLSDTGFDEPWEETSRRKPEKSSRIESAKILYSKLASIPTPQPWPQI
tara:strand:+ start:869 stop:1381 length:513 start_codon:yes stop_codon:yes gene_type:complete